MDNLCSCLELKRDIEQLEDNITKTLKEVERIKITNNKLIEIFSLNSNVVYLQLKNK